MQHASESVPESHALIVADGAPVGYLCWQSPPKEELEAANLTDLPSGLVDIDILIGHPDLLGQGVGLRASRPLRSRGWVRPRQTRMPSAASRRQGFVWIGNSGT
jgi:hypothetical protein